jgi:hypothetical protein
MVFVLRGEIVLWVLHDYENNNWGSVWSKISETCQHGALLSIFSSMAININLSWTRSYTREILHMYNIYETREGKIDGINHQHQPKAFLQMPMPWIFCENSNIIKHN